MLDFLPTEIKEKIVKQFIAIYEVRIRVDTPILVVGSNGNGVEKRKLNYIFSKEGIYGLVLKLSNYSIFSVEESLKLGFITSSCGERVGVCGEVVNEQGKVLSIKNFTSLCVRFPNQVIGCAKEYYSRLSLPRSCLVVSPPFHGKTTFIRDLARAYSDEFDKVVLFIDERDELSVGGNFYLGKNSDLLRFSSKDFGFTNGVRAYNPEVIVCDEIINSSDLDGVRFALSSGVKVIASLHGDSMENILKKQGISDILKDNLFEDIIILDRFKIKAIYGGGEWKE